MSKLREKLDQDQKNKKDGNFIRNQMLNNNSIVDYYNKTYLEREQNERFYNIGRILDKNNQSKYKYFKNS